MAEKFEVSDIFAEVRQVLADNAGYSAAVAGAIAGGYVVLDLLSERAGNFGSIAVTVFVQYMFLEHVLLGRIEPGGAVQGRRYGALFGSGFLSTLGILAASIFLIVPGIYLAARWALTSAFVVAERTGSTESLSASWKATQPSGTAIFFAMLIFMVAVIALAAAAIGLSVVLESLGPWMEIVLINVVVAAYSVGGWILSAAIFRLVRIDQSALTDVFG